MASASATPASSASSRPTEPRACSASAPPSPAQRRASASRSWADSNSRAIVSEALALAVSDPTAAAASCSRVWTRRSQSRSCSSRICSRSLSRCSSAVGEPPPVPGLRRGRSAARPRGHLAAWRRANARVAPPATPAGQPAPRAARPPTGRSPGPRASSSDTSRSADSAASISDRKSLVGRQARRAAPEDRAAVGETPQTGQTFVFGIDLRPQPAQRQLLLTDVIRRASPLLLHPPGSAPRLGFGLSRGVDFAIALGDSCFGLGDRGRQRGPPLLHLDRLGLGRPRPNSMLTIRPEAMTILAGDLKFGGRLPVGLAQASGDRTCLLQSRHHNGRAEITGRKPAGVRS